jgi:hypothetical protein
MYTLLLPPESWPPGSFPTVERATNYYLERAPEQLPIRLASAVSQANSIQFANQSLDYLPETAGFGAVTHVQFAQLIHDGPEVLLVCDGRYGLVLAGSPGKSDRLKVLGTVPQPCHVQVVDLDRDGFRDVLVASLGEFKPTDAKKGAVYWLRGRPRGAYETVELLSGIGRVADVRAADFDGDADLDLIIAEFGWRAVGGLIYAENVTVDEEVPAFELRRLDGRRGAVHIPVTDLNGDGHSDFLALFSQESESVVAFINDGSGYFSTRTIFDARNPAWGFSGMELVDMDNDGRLDVLMTNGDTFDNFVLKPYHGISWLRNDGDLSFSFHHVADMPAVYNAKAADMDADGDKDIVACAFFAPAQDYSGVEPDALESLVWFEQEAPGSFRRHLLQRGECVHLSLDLADCDGDGFIDIVVGVWPSGPYQQDETRKWDWVTLLRRVP